METTVYITLILLVAIDVYCLVKLYKLVRKLNEQEEKQKKALAEAGNAITDTLRVAFDNLKRNTSEHNKINAKLNEYNARIHRLEQHNNRNANEAGKRTNIIQEKVNENEE